MKICVQSGGIVEHIGMQKCYELIGQAGFTGIDWNAVEHACPPAVIRDPALWESCVYLRPLEEVVAYFAPEVVVSQPENSSSEDVSGQEGGVSSALESGGEDDPSASSEDTASAEE